MKHLTEAILKDLRLPITVFEARRRGDEKVNIFLREQGLKLPVYCFFSGSTSDFAVGVHNGNVLALCTGPDNKYLLIEQRPDGQCVVKNWYQGVDQAMFTPKDIHNLPTEHPATLHGYPPAQEALASYLTPFISLSNFDKAQMTYYKENSAWLL